MANLLCRLEGTWQEIAARVPDFDTRKLEVVVYDAEETQNDTSATVILQEAGATTRLTLTEILREIEERSRLMNPKPGATDWLREGRDGGMFGYDPAE